MPQLQHLTSGLDLLDGVESFGGSFAVIIFPANSIQAVTMPPIQKDSGIEL